MQMHCPTDAHGTQRLTVGNHALHSRSVQSSTLSQRFPGRQRPRDKQRRIQSNRECPQATLAMYKS